MFMPDSYSVALILMLLGMLCWGSWPNTYKLTRGWRFELFYWDYAFGIFLTAIVVGLTLGSLFGPESAWGNLIAADGEAWLYAGLAGIIWNAGNVLLVAGVSLVGLAVAFPVSIGLALVVGVIGSYLIAPKGDPVLLYTGVALVLVAVILNSLAYRAAAAKRSRASRGGLWMCLFSGILFSGFGPLLAKAYSTPRPLSPYGAEILFTLGALLSTLPVMGYFMRRPVEGPPVTAAHYFKGTWGEHAAGLLGGFVWGLGATFTFVPMAMVGTALAYAIGQSNPLVAAVWGVFVWREFQGAPRKSKVMLALMFALYILGLLLLALSFRAS
jgi:glucose uptake protein